MWRSQNTASVSTSLIFLRLLSFSFSSLFLSFPSTLFLLSFPLLPHPSSSFPSFSSLCFLFPLFFIFTLCRLLLFFFFLLIFFFLLSSLSLIFCNFPPVSPLPPLTSTPKRGKKRRWRPEGHRSWQCHLYMPGCYPQTSLHTQGTFQIIRVWACPLLAPVQQDLSLQLFNSQSPQPPVPPRPWPSEWFHTAVCW